MDMYMYIQVHDVHSWTPLAPHQDFPLTMEWAPHHHGVDPGDLVAPRHTTISVEAPLETGVIPQWALHLGVQVDISADPHHREAAMAAVLVS